MLILSMTTTRARILETVSNLLIVFPFGQESNKESWRLGLFSVSCDMQQPYWLMLLPVPFGQEFDEEIQGCDLLFVSHVM